MTTLVEVCPVCKGAGVFSLPTSKLVESARRALLETNVRSIATPWRQIVACDTCDGKGDLPVGETA